MFCIISLVVFLMLFGILATITSTNKLYQLKCLLFVGIIVSVECIIINQILYSNPTGSLETHTDNNDLIKISGESVSIDPESQFQKEIKKICNDIEQYNSWVDLCKSHNLGYESRNIFTAIGYHKVPLHPAIDKEKLLADLQSGLLVPDYSFYLKTEE